MDEWPDVVYGQVGISAFAWMAGHLSSSLRPASVAGGFWAVILSRAAWKKSWVGRDPTRSIILTDRSVAITGDTVRAQLLTGLDHRARLG